MSAAKSPISALSELMRKWEIPDPAYEFLDFGPNYFECTASVTVPDCGPCTETAGGPTKKTAKSQAAQLLLGHPALISLATSAPPPAENTVGMLLTLTQKVGLDPPVFTDAQVPTGAATNPTWQTTAVLTLPGGEVVTASGQGLGKQAAKRRAADSLLEREEVKTLKLAPPTHKPGDRAQQHKFTINYVSILQVCMCVVLLNATVLYWSLLRLCLCVTKRFDWVLS